MRPCWQRTLAVVLAVALAHGSAMAAEPAEVDAQADRLIATGVSLRHDGKDEEALAQFSRAYELSHGPHARAQMGLAEQALGRWDLAEAHLAEALTATNDAWIKKHRADLESALTEVRGHLGTLELSGGVPGAEVRVNGEPVARLPLTAPMRLAAGTVVIEIVASGYVPMTRTVTVPAGGLARETFVLVKEAASPLAAPEPAASLTTPPGPAAAVTLAETGPSSSAWRKPGAWIAAGGAVVALGVGVGFLARMYSNEHSFNQSCGLADPNLGGPGCASYHDRATGSQAPAIAGLTAGALLAGASGYLFWSSARQDQSSATRSAWRCLPGVTAPGISCGTSFR
jgi:hypothetical protein